MKKVPTTYSMEEIDSLYKIFEQWQISYDEKKSSLRKEKIKAIINGKLGWVIAIIQGLTAIIKNIVDIL
jgi:TRAP-type mannitol/chloroaromatic compound transport system permease small subunit